MDDLTTYRARIGLYSVTCDLKSSKILRNKYLGKSNFKSRHKQIPKKRMPDNTIHTKSAAGVGHISLYVLAVLCLTVSRLDTCPITSQRLLPDITGWASYPGCQVPCYMLPATQPGVAAYVIFNCSCDPLLGNAGIHSYNGNPRSHIGSRASEDKGLQNVTAVHDLHFEMVDQLESAFKRIATSLWNKFKLALKLKTRLPISKLEQAEDMYCISNLLEEHRDISPGSYDKLKECLHGNNECLDIINSFEYKMRLALQCDQGDVGQNSTSDQCFVVVCDNAEGNEGLPAQGDNQPMTTTALEGQMTNVIPTEGPVTTTVYTEQQMTTTLPTEEPMDIYVPNEVPIATVFPTGGPMTTSCPTERQMTTGALEGQMTNLIPTEGPVTTTVYTEQQMTTILPTEEPMDIYVPNEVPIATVFPTGGPMTNSCPTERQMTTVVTERPTNITGPNEEPAVHAFPTEGTIATTDSTEVSIANAVPTEGQVTTTVPTQGQMTTTLPTEVNQSPITVDLHQIVKQTDIRETRITNIEPNIKVKNPQNVFIGSNNVVYCGADKNPKLTAMIETTKSMILKENENYTYIQTKSLQEAHEKLMTNRIVIVKGNTGDGKTSIALQLLELLCNEQEEGQQKRCRQPLELHDIKDFDLVEPNSQLVIFCDDIFGKNVVCGGDVKEWEKRERSVLPKFGNDRTKANFLIITIRSTIFNCVNGPSLENIFTKQNIVDLNKSLDEKEKLELLRLYKPEDQFDSWTDDEEKEIVKCAPDIGFPQCCRLFKDTPTLRIERVNFFRRPFHFMKSSLSKLKDGKFYGLLYLFLNGGRVMKDDLDTCNKKIDKQLLEAAFAVDVVKVTPTVELVYNKERKLEFVQESLECLLGWLVKKENMGSQGCERYCYKFNHDSIEETVALLYGEKTPIGYIQNCPDTFLKYITTSKLTPNSIVISSKDQINAMYTRLVKQFESGYSRLLWYNRYIPIASFDVCKDTQFLQGFIRWLSDKQVDKNVRHNIHISLLDVYFPGVILLYAGEMRYIYKFCVIKEGGMDVLKNIVKYLNLNDEIKLALFNQACSSGAEEYALYFLSEGVKPNKASPYCVVKGRSVNVLRKLLEYDETRIAREYASPSLLYAHYILVLNAAGLFENKDMVTMLCDTCPHLLLYDTFDKRGNTLNLVAVKGNCGIFQTVEKTVLQALCRVEDAQHKCELVDGCVVHRSCACAQYMSQLVEDVSGMTVLHLSCNRGHMDLCLYLCAAYPGLTTAVDDSGWHCLHHIAGWTSDVVMFTECETRVKQYLESTGRKYDIKDIRTSMGYSVLDASTSRGQENNPLQNHLARLFNK